MKKRLIIGICLMLVVVGVLSGCVKKNSVTYEDKIIDIIEDKQLFNPNRYIVIFSNNMTQRCMDENVLHLDFNRTIRITFVEQSYDDGWNIESYKYLE
jgi:hypothetical protein